VRAARATIETSYPTGHPYFGDLAYWLGVVALAEGDARGAQPELERAVARRAAQLPPQHPKVLEASCALAVARARAGAVTAALASDARRSCEGFARWGLANPLVVAWGREVVGGR
jgi:hypothetical protein